jgi:hypothetical protein
VHLGCACQQLALTSGRRGGRLLRARGHGCGNYSVAASRCQLLLAHRLLSAHAGHADVAIWLISFLGLQEKGGS